MAEFSGVYNIGDPRIRFQSCEQCKFFTGNVPKDIALAGECKKLKDPKECTNHKHRYREPR